MSGTKSINLFVRKQHTPNGVPRYRFSVSRVDLSYKDLKNYGKFFLRFSTSMSEHDQQTAIERLCKNVENCKIQLV